MKKGEAVRIKTCVSVDQAVGIFKDAMQERRRIRSMAGQVTTVDMLSGSDLYTGNRANAASVGIVAHLKGDLFDRNAMVFMRGWLVDNGSELELSLTTAPLTRGSKARRQMGNFIESLRSQDSGIEVLDG